MYKNSYAVELVDGNGGKDEYELEADRFVCPPEIQSILFLADNPIGGEPEILAFIPLNRLVSVIRIDPEEEEAGEPVSASNGKA